MKISFNPNRPFIAVNVFVVGKEGIKELNMALDTGASLVRIPTRVAETLGLVSKGEVETLNVLRTENSEITDVPRIIIGETEAKNIPAIISDLPPESQVDGLLGLSFLKNFDLCVNFSHGYLEFAS